MFGYFFGKKKYLDFITFRKIIYIIPIAFFTLILSKYSDSFFPQDDTAFINYFIPMIASLIFWFLIFWKLLRFIRNDILKFDL